jgi:type IV pilus assembly protein PilA
MSKSAQGFTLIELMIVVAIIGILSSIAIPQYQSYVARSQMAESIVMMNVAKVMIEDYVIDNGAFPVNQSLLIALDINVTGTYGSITGVSTTSSDSGTMVYKTSGSNVNKNILNNSVWFNRESITGKWSCNSDAQVKHIPKSCIYSNSTPIGS